MANLYEIITIIHPNETDDGVQAIIGGLRQQLTSSGGTVRNVDIWGRKKLAFNIGKNDEGIYVLFHAEGPSTLPAEFRAHTKIRDSILRELVVRLEGVQEDLVRTELEEKGPEDAEEAAAQIAAAEARAADKRARAAAAVSGAAAEESEEGEEGEEEAARAKPAEPVAEPESAAVEDDEEDDNDDDDEDSDEEA